MSLSSTSDSNLEARRATILLNDGAAVAVVVRGLLSDFDGFSQQYKVKEAEAQADQGEAQLHDTEHQVLMEIVKAYADAQPALANLDASQTLQQAAEAALASAKKRYDRGVADVLELITAEQALADADQESVRCLAEWRSARLRLVANAGVLGLDLIRHEGAAPTATRGHLLRRGLRVRAEAGFASYREPVGQT